MVAEVAHQAVLAVAEVWGTKITTLLHPEALTQLLLELVATTQAVGEILTLFPHVLLEAVAVAGPLVALPAVLAEAT